MTAFVRYHGGKVRMAPMIVQMFPPHFTYVEPFGGGAAVLLAKSRARLEVYNDLDGDMVNLFRVLRDQPDAILRSVALTPFAREELEASLTGTGDADPVERARRVLVRSHMGHGGYGTTWRTGFRGAGLRAGTLPVHLWQRMPVTVAATAERVRGVVIEQRPAIEVMNDHDGDTTLHYIDPPYVHETRGKHRYRHDMADEQHIELLEAVRNLRGAVVLSGYPHPIYDEALRDWRRIEIRARADHALSRTEVLWINFEGPSDSDLFDAAGDQ